MRSISNNISCQSDLYYRSLHYLKKQCYKIKHWLIKLKIYCDNYLQIVLQCILFSIISFNLKRKSNKEVSILQIRLIYYLIGL